MPIPLILSSKGDTVILFKGFLQVEGEPSGVLDK
jgi:hypothetical protein